MDAGHGFTRDDPEALRLALAVLGVLLRIRRTRPGDPCAGLPCEACIAPHLPVVLGSVARREPIRLILPGFPAKAPNPRKVLGSLPDMAERLALARLGGLCEEIGAAYGPGSQFTICSDGHVFADLVGVADDDAEAYGRGIRSIIRDLGIEPMSHLDLGAILGTDGGPDVARRMLLDRYGEPVGAYHGRIAADPALGGLFNGLHRFLFEDMVVRAPGRSRNSVRNEAKATTYAMIARGAAWSALLRERFAGAVRLSIHPHPGHGEKLGVRLIESDDSWGAPWHGAAVCVGGRFRVMKRAEAEALGAELVYRDGRPSHFVAPGGARGRDAGSAA